MAQEHSKFNKSPDIMNARNSFMDLPAEIRNIIYEHRLRIVMCAHCTEQMFLNDTRSHDCMASNRNNQGEAAPVQCFACIFDKQFDEVGTADFGHFCSRHAVQNDCKQDLRAPALTQVSRLIRAEALPVYYGQNALKISIDTRYLTPLDTRWLKIIGPANAALLKDIRFTGRCFASFLKYPEKRILPKLEDLQLAGVPVDTTVFHFNIRNGFLRERSASYLKLTGDEIKNKIGNEDGTVPGKWYLEVFRQ